MAVSTDKWKVLAIATNRLIAEISNNSNIAHTQHTAFSRSEVTAVYLSGTCAYRRKVCLTSPLKVTTTHYVLSLSIDVQSSLGPPAGYLQLSLTHTSTL